ncbi:MAG: hypothetical protein BWY20_02422 [Spirochaetes bacterium ADurb.Bin215]|nr:MAG: hypothetical protein BWY20_02422 [Spirochaetes bacterium ADurb.Bin215]
MNPFQAMFPFSCFSLSRETSPVHFTENQNASVRGKKYARRAGLSGFGEHCLSRRSGCLRGLLNCSDHGLKSFPRLCGIPIPNDIDKRGSVKIGTVEMKNAFMRYPGICGEVPAKTAFGNPGRHCAVGRYQIPGAQGAPLKPGFGGSVFREAAREGKDGLSVDLRTRNDSHQLPPRRSIQVPEIVHVGRENLLELRNCFPVRFD